MPFHLFIFLFNYQYLVLIIPMSIMILLTYFGSGVKEGPKTIFGAIYVMIYIIGVYAYMAAGIAAAAFGGGNGSGGDLASPAADRGTDSHADPDE